MTLLALRITLLYCFSTTFVFAGYICVEAPGNILPFWESIKIPKKSVDQPMPLIGFCSTNPHGFSITSASLDPPEIPLDCYVASPDKLVIELPNRRFCADIKEEKLDQIVDHLAFQLADYYMSAFTIILFNKKHNFYREEAFHSEHPIFSRVIERRRRDEKFLLFAEKYNSGEYPSEFVACLTSDKTIDGKDCPAELLEQPVPQ